MNSASNHYNAETKAGPRARCLVRAALACALACMALGGGNAYAQHDRGDRGDQAGPPERHGERFQLPPQDRDQRQGDMRAYEEQRRQQQMQQQMQQDQRRSSGRMTPDERRDLRRQINEANMDLYPQRR
jgi:Spy/CpxP family protein refolding chaperone